MILLQNQSPENTVMRIALALLLSLFVSTTKANQKIDFELKDIHGKTVNFQTEFSDNKAVVVTFIGTECPLVKLYSSRLNKFASQYRSKSIEFIAISSNQQDTIEELKAFARSQKINFPILKDPGNEVADQFNASRTPEVFVLNDEFEVVYQGTIDDQYTYGIQQSQPKNNYLLDVLNAIGDSQPIAISKTEAVGCIIGRKLKEQKNSPVTFHDQISRIFQKKCIRCHREGELAPFSLSDYDEVAGWAGMIEEVVKDRRMPPWHADAKNGVFKNDARLNEEEKKLIFDWVAAGAPAGDIAKAPKKLNFAKGWQIGRPDKIIKMRYRPFKVPATGVVEYKHFLVDPKFQEDKWIKAAECRPGNRSVVHHIIVGVRGEGEFGGHESDALQSEWIAATAPGAPPMILPDGYAKFVPAGSKLIFQMHYTPNGTAQEDLSEIGFVFAEPQSIKKQVMTLMTYNPKIRIPAGEENYRTTSRFTFDQDMELLSMFPHMHYRGKKFRYEFKLPGHSYQTWLNVPNYDFNWQNAYELSEYRQIPRGTKLRCVAHFDNSDKNLANPNPDRTVSWGDQTWDEMMIGYFDVAVDVDSSQP